MPGDVDIDKNDTAWVDLVGDHLEPGLRGLEQPVSMLGVAVTACGEQLGIWQSTELFSWPIGFSNADSARPREASLADGVSGLPERMLARPRDADMSPTR
jgi:hypothetical protein